MPMDTRTIALGVDGATYDLLDEWIQAGELPNFESIADEGLDWALETTIPTRSIPAWPSFNSGTNLGTHGLLDFNCDLDSDSEELVDQTNLRSGRFWDVLAEDGVSPITLGGLLTYPPREVQNGVEVSGPMTPESAEVFTTPESVSERIRELVPGYEFGPSLDGSRRAVRDACIESAEQRATVAKDLMTEHNWQFFFGLFIATDRAQHKLWDTPEEILPVYKKVDDFIGWVREKYPEANVILFSDHGFTSPPERDFFLNAWLASRNDTAEGSPDTSLKYTVAKWSYSNARHYLGINFRDLAPARLETWLTDTGESSSSPVRAAKRNIDGVHVDLPNDQEVIEDMINDLCDLTDPETGSQVFRGVYRKEDLYEGKYVEDLPEIILLPNPEYNVNTNPSNNVFGLFPGSENEGMHDAAREGVLMMAGPNVKQDPERKTASLLDIPPTLLHMCDSPIPSNYDGKVLTDTLTGAPAQREVASREPLHTGPEMISTAEDREDVEERLSDLGYL